MEQDKAALAARIDYNNYFRPIPAGLAFDRFDTLPRGIILEFVFKDAQFYLEKDYTRDKKKVTYKLAPEKGNGKFNDRLKKQQGWVIFKGMFS